MLACYVCALAHRFELLPNDRWMNLSLVKRLRREATVGASHNVFTAHEIRETYQPFSYPFRMFNDVTGVGDNPRANYFSIRQLSSFEKVVFMFVAWIRRLEAE